MSIDPIASNGPAWGADKALARSETVAMAAPAGARAPAAPATTAAVKGVGAEPSLEQVTQAVSDLNKSQQAQLQGLEFSIDSDSKRTVIKVVDQDTREVLRQIPSVEALELAKSLDSSKGLLPRQTA